MLSSRVKNLLPVQGVGLGAGPEAALLVAAGHREGLEGLEGLQESPEEEGDGRWECMTSLAAFTSLLVPCYKHTHTHTPYTHVSNK